MKSNLPYNVMRHRDSWDVAPRDPFTVGNAILAALNVQVGSLFVIYGVGYLATTAITSLALKALAPKVTGTEGTLVNAREAAAPQDYVYGQVRKGGTITFMESTGTKNKFLHVVISLAGHEVEELGDIYVNDEVVTLDVDGFVTDDRWESKIRIKKWDGSQTTADSDFVAETSATSEFVSRDVAALYVRLQYDTSVFTSGVPLFTVVIKGRKVYDPRTSTTGYSANAALCIRDYITSDIGLNDPEVDDVQFTVAANDCDDDVPLAEGGTEKRYSINGVVRSDQTIGSNLSEMVKACNGSIPISGGTYGLRVGVYTASVASFTLDDLRSDIDLQTRLSLRDNFNQIVGKFISAADNWIETDYPAIQSDVFLAEDAGIENQIDIPLPYVTSSPQAQRVAKQMLFRSREQMTFVCEFGLSAIGVEIGDIVDLTIDAYGWDQKEFEVVDWELKIADTGGVRIGMTLRETSEAAFSWDAEESEIISNATNLLRYNEVPSVGVSAVATTRILNEKVTNILTVTTTSSLPFQVDYVEVEIKLSSDETYRSLGTGQLGNFEAIDLENGEYDVRARAVNPFGYYGEWEYLFNVSAVGDVSPPDDVTNLFAEVNGQSVTLDWEPVASVDLSYYQVRHSIDESAATWANATTAIDKVARPSTSVSLPLRAGTYMVRAYDKEGLQSNTAASVVVPSQVLPSFTNTLTQSEHSTFSGTKTGCGVVSGELQITDTSSAPSEATYEFSTYIDTLTVGTRYCRIRCGTQRHDESAGLFDDLVGLFDSLAGLFDDLTGFSQIGDTNVLFYISTTNDDPTSSPTWSEYRQFRAGNFYGRAFRFKIVLKSETINVTPSVGTLQAIVEWN